MGIILKALVALIIIALLALLAFAYWPGSLDPVEVESRQPVMLDVD